MTAETTTAAHQAEIVQRAHHDAAEVKMSHGIEGAYKKFREELDTAHAGMTKQDRTRYDAVFNKDLTQGKHPLLPKLELYAKEHPTTANSKQNPTKADPPEQAKHSADHEVQKGETIWSIAKKDLPAGATNQQINERAKEIARDNKLANPNRIKTGDTVKVSTDAKAANQPPKDDPNTKTSTQADGGVVVEKQDGTKTTTWHGDKGDTVKVERSDGTGYVKNADKSEHHWGPNAEDNFDVPAGGGKQVSVEGDKTTTTWSDDQGTTVKVENKDGTGFVRNADGTVHHWGPNQEDNYDRDKDGNKVSKQSDGSTVVEGKDGTKTTTWHSDKGDTVKVEKKDGTGYTKDADKSEHHWGPNPEDNFDVPAGGGKTVTVNGDTTTTTWTDDKGTSVKVENKDGTGFVRNADGSVHHWGPNPDDNYDRDKDGNKMSQQSDGSTIAEASDGTKTTTWHGDKGDTVKVEHPDGSGYVKNADKSEHHWGNKDVDNYDIPPPGSGKVVTVDGAKTTTAWSDDKGTTIKVENKDGTGFVRNPNGSIHHWGPNQEDNYDTTATS